MTTQTNHRKIDRLTVMITSITLVLFCLCSYWMLSVYSDIQTDISHQTNDEIELIQQHIKHLNTAAIIDRQALSDELSATQKALKSRQNDWLILQQTLNSMITILIGLVFAHLYFVYHLFSGKN